MLSLGELDWLDLGATCGDKTRVWKERQDYGREKKKRQDRAKQDGTRRDATKTGKDNLEPGMWGGMGAGRPIFWRRLGVVWRPLWGQFWPPRLLLDGLEGLDKTRREETRRPKTRQERLSWDNAAQA